MAMRQVCNPTITIPYWASTLEETLNDPTVSVVWSPEFFGNGYNFVETGPFGNWTDGTGRRISRNLNHIGGVLTESDIERVVERNTHYHDIFMNPRTKDFANTLEGINYNVHGYVGGTMNRLDRAAYDPVFIFHYAYIDHLFEKARENFRMKGFNPANDYPNCPGIHDSQAPMANFTFFRNIDGLNDIWTNQYFYYDDVPTCSALNRDCGTPYLTCANIDGQWKCQSTVTKYAFDTSPEVPMASNLLNQQLPGQQFPAPVNNPNAAFPGLNGPSNPLGGIVPNQPRGPPQPNLAQMGGFGSQQTAMNPGQPNLEPNVPVPQTVVGPRPQMGPSSLNSQFGAASNPLPEQPNPDPTQGHTGLGQTHSISGVPNTLGSGMSHFGNQIIHSLPVQSNPQQPPSQGHMQLPQSPHGNQQQSVQGNVHPQHGNMQNGVHSPFNPFEQANQNVGMELPVMGTVTGMELPVIDPPSPNQVDPHMHMNPFDQFGPSPVASGPEQPQVQNPMPQVATTAPPVAINPPQVQPMNTAIGPQPAPPMPKSTPVAPQVKQKAPSIISNLNVPGNNPQAPGGNFFSWRQNPHNSFSIRRQRRSVFSDLPTPLNNDITSWIHELAYPIQNTYEIDGVADSSKWLYVPIAIKTMRAPNHTYEINGYKNGLMSTYDIYDPRTSNQFQRRLKVDQLPQRTHSSISGSGASKVYLKSDGLSYEGSYLDYVLVDNRMPISEYVGYVAVKDPKFGRSQSFISVFDSLGELCKPRCATSRSRSNPKYRPCSGLIEADTSNPEMAYKSIPDAVLDMWTIKDPYPPRVSRPPYLEFLCDNTNTLYWDGCENDRYQ